MDGTKPDTLTPGFAALLKSAATEARPLRVEIDDEPFEITVVPAARSATAGIWDNYDAGRLRAVLRRNAQLPERANREDLDRLLSDIQAQRGQDSRGRPATP